MATKLEKKQKELIQSLLDHNKLLTEILGDHSKLANESGWKINPDQLEKGKTHFTKIEQLKKEVADLEK